MAYTPTNWKRGDVVTSEKLNKLESGVQEASSSGAAPEPIVIAISYSDVGKSIDIGIDFGDVVDAFESGVPVFVEYSSSPSLQREKVYYWDYLNRLATASFVLRGARGSTSVQIEASDNNDAQGIQLRTGTDNGQQYLEINTTASYLESIFTGNNSKYRQASAIIVSSSGLESQVAYNMQLQIVGCYESFDSVSPKQMHFIVIGPASMTADDSTPGIMDFVASTRDAKPRYYLPAST